jgi:hypothetical protein
VVAVPSTEPRSESSVMLPPLATLTLPCTSRSRFDCTSIVELVLPVNATSIA